MQLIYELCIACAVLMLYRASHRRELALYNELKTGKIDCSLSVLLLILNDGVYQ